MKKFKIIVTRSMFYAFSDSSRGGWQVSYVERNFDTKGEAEEVASYLRDNPSDSVRTAMSEGRFVDDVPEFQELLRVVALNTAKFEAALLRQKQI